MRQLYYTNYRSGHAGLSNGIMSIECGVVMAFLTKRFLLLDGNMSPPGNIVDYDGRVDNSSPSRITDLLDIPVPWGEPNSAELAQLESRELADYSLMDSVFYIPGTVDIDSRAARDFARGREHWICEDAQLAEVPVLRVSEEPLIPGSEYQRNNLCFYSYLFYLDDETRRATWEMLSRLQAQAPYAELAKKVAADLGGFNAVHIRRGDFKVTYGVTVLDRNPWEAVDALDNHFNRGDRLLICTDEMNDPFFDEIKAGWTDHVFIDHHILENYAQEFAALPKSDSLALAYLSQLVAAESQDFIGSMTSTFTAMIQRLRGNRGKAESFKFLWNELPDPGEKLERGSHPISNCVPLENGVMVPEYDGAYSWNRFTHLLNPAWMREWPESFLTPQAIQLSQRPAISLASSNTYSESEEASAFFEGLRIRISTAVPGLAFMLDNMLEDAASNEGSRVIAELEVEQQAGRFFLRAGGEITRQVTKEGNVPNAILDHLVPIFARARAHHSWLDGMVLERGDTTVLFVGDWNYTDAGDTIANALCDAGWTLRGDEVIPVRSASCEAIPFARCNYPRGSTKPIAKVSKLDAIVYTSRQLHNRASLFSLSPSAAVAELTGSARDFLFEREKAIKRLCELVEQLPVYQLNYSRPQETPAFLKTLLETMQDASREQDDDVRSAGQA